MICFAKRYTHVICRCKENDRRYYKKFIVLMSTKIYCDIADINKIKKFNKKKIVKGFTTNPSLMRKAGAKNY